jgi:hypothetical protein
MLGRMIVRALSAVAVLAIATDHALAAEGPPSVAVNAIALGGLSRTNFGMGMLEARVTLSPHLQLTAAPAVVSIEDGGTELQFRAGATLLLQAGPFRLDDRNMWAFSDAGTTRYRNRLRLTAPLQIGGRVLRVQLLDEVFYEEGGRGWFRNMVGAGVGVDVGRSFSADTYWLLQDDDHRPQASLFLLMLTAHLR